jgi:urea transport system permease protein
MKLPRVIVLLFSFLAAGLAPASADEAGLRETIAKFAAARDFKATEAVVRELAATGDPAVERVLLVLADGNLFVRKADNAVFAGMETGQSVTLLDPLTGEKAGEAAKSGLSKVKVNNALRRVIRDLLGGLTLGSTDPATRLAAADTMFRTPDAANIEALDAAIEREAVASVKARLEQARAASVLVSDRTDEEKIAAIGLVAARGDRDALSLLTAVLARSEGAVRDAAEGAIAQVNGRLALWSAAQNVWYGVSLGSVLLLAAIGLAITFGVMGVINMAHGEMVMLGAYTTYVVQDIIRTSFPGLCDWSLAFALPLAFLVAAAVGLAIERGIIRFLYGRPLETLLATWGVSLILQQSVRTIFGPTNREVGNPSWMSGGFDLGQLAVTWNRFWIVLFALGVFAVLLYVMKRTPWGLQMRAVTANRRMAASHEGPPVNPVFWNG